MKTTFKALGLVLLMGASFTFTSCEKDDVRKVAPKSTVNTPDEVDNEEPTENQTKAVVVNASNANDLAGVSVFLNGDKLVSDLGLGEVSSALPVDLGQVQLDIFDKDGGLLTTSNITLLENEVYNIVLGVGADGVTPEIKLLGMDLGTFQGGDSLGQGLGFGNLLGEQDLFGLNFLNLTDGLGGLGGGGLGGDNLLAGLDFLNADGDLVGGLLELIPGDLSGTLFGNNDILKGLDILGSDLPLQDLLGQLTGGSSGLDLLNLGDVVGLGNISNGGLLEGLVSLLTDLLGGILGGGSSNPLELLQGDILKGLPALEPGSDYTVILTETVDGLLKPILVDQTDLLSFLQQP